MKPSGTSLHKLAAQFVKHKRAGAPVCRPQTGRTELVLHKLGRPVCAVSCPRGWRLAILGLGDVAQPKPCRSPANGPRPTAQISDARVGTRALVASPLVLAYDAFLSGSTPGRRARPVLASPKADGCTTGSGPVRTPGRALAAEGPRPRQTGRPGLADLMAL